MDSLDVPSGLKTALIAALPICLGYAPLGAACGMLSAKAGLLPVQVLFLSAFLYAGGAQFMVANLSILNVSPFSVAVSVALLNARHLLYGSALSRYFANQKRGQAVVFGLEITDETFGINYDRFARGDWPVHTARMVNTIAHLCWVLFSMIGVTVGNLLPIPLPVIAFSMTSMFLCLLCMQEHTKETLRAVACAAVIVLLCKLLGLSEISVLLGSIGGVAAGILMPRKRREENEVA